MQLNKQGIYDTVIGTHRQIAQRMCCLIAHHRYNDRVAGRTFLPVMPMGITEAGLRSRPCARCETTAVYAEWTRTVWAKYAEREWKFQATLIDRDQFDSWRVPSTPDLTARGRWIPRSQDLEFSADPHTPDRFGTMLYYDRYERFIKLTLTAQDSDWSTATRETVDLNLGWGFRGAQVAFPGRMQPREATVELHVPYRDWTYAMKDGVVFIDMQQAAAELMDLYDWWVNNPKSIPKQLTRLSVKQALTASEKWHGTVRKKAEKQSAGPITKDDKPYLGELTITYKRLKEGYNHRNSISQALRAWVHNDDAYEDEVRTYKVHELKTAKALQDEGNAMRNCIGSYYTELSHSRFASVVGENRNDSFSVHFKNGMIGGVVILQARGFANRALETSEERQLQAGLELLTGMQKA